MKTGLADLDERQGLKKENVITNVRESLNTFKSSIIVIDAGNTRTKFCLYDGQGWKKQSISSDKKRTIDGFADEFKRMDEGNNFDISQIKGVIISSVVPDIDANIQEAVKQHYGIKPIMVSSDLDLGMHIQYDNPKALGADRIFNAVAAKELYGGPAIIIDMGTATTIDAIDEENFLGGSILPGIELGVKSLATGTSKLPQISINDKPDRVIGKNTVDCIKSGSFYGNIGSIDNIVREAKKEMNRKDVKVIGTGGSITLIAKYLNEIDIIDNTLGLEGLRIIYERNKK